MGEQDARKKNSRDNPPNFASPALPPKHRFLLLLNHDLKCDYVSPGSCLLKVTHLDKINLHSRKNLFGHALAGASPHHEKKNLVTES